MTSKEKASELFMKYYSLIPAGVIRYTSLTGMAQKCALIKVDGIIEALENFGYAMCMYDDFETGKITTTDDKNPCDYWREVKNEIEKM
ncbi:MAG TPA: hypothetical protein VN026_00845 [Bacteroidia bacterium]|jgi:hypothetical protein|nr:hypothetical protein [Bacteroidia bacterium]